MTVAHEIKYPIRQHSPWPKGAKHWDDLTPFQKRGRSKHWKEGYRNTFITIWHVDPCKGPGGDDSCGWFMRSHHGNKDVLQKIERRFEFDWDRVFETSKKDHDPEDGEFHKKTYFCGLFKPNGDPHLSVHAIVLNLFWSAAHVYFDNDWAKAKQFMRKHLLDILLFAENPVDSLFDGITRKFEKGCGEEYGTRARSERIHSMASCIYAWILRETRPWYKHPKWHIHHWKIQCHPLQRWVRWLKKRCKVCGKRIKPSDGGVVADGWSDNSSLTCGKCSGMCGVVNAEPCEKANP